MKYMLFLLILTSCGPEFQSAKFTSVNCTVVRKDSTTTISCPGGSYSVIKDGQDGIQGSTGNSGNNGHSAVFSQANAGISLCPTGGYVLSSGVDLNDNLLLELSETKYVAVICNGLKGNTGYTGDNGSNGTNGTNSPPTPFTPVGLIDPCGDAPGRYDEVFLKLANGTILASFSDNANGQNTRFSVLTTGTYSTTDGDSCIFTIDSHGTITYENHHY